MTTGDQTPQVVFACVRNGGRSVISRVLTEHYARGAVVALSAGTQPGEHIHAEVAEVLERLGLDTTKEHPKLLTRDTIASSDVAITLGCGEECPYVPGVKYVDWPVRDPAGQDEATVRAIVADLDTRVRDLLGELFRASSCKPQWSTRGDGAFLPGLAPLDAGGAWAGSSSAPAQIRWLRSRYSARSAPVPSPSGVYARSIHSKIQVTTSLRR